MSKRSSSPSSVSSFAQEKPHTPAPLLSKKEQKVLGNTREIAWLQRQIEDMDMELNPRIPEQPTLGVITVDDLNDYQKDISVRRGELLTISNYITQKEQVLSNVQHQFFMEEALYPLASDSMDQLENKRAVQNTITQLDELAMELMKELAPRLEQKMQLIDIRKEIDQVEENNKELFKTYLNEYNEPLENKVEILGLLEREGQLQEQTEMTRRVLVAIIVESRLDWANDSKLRNLVLKIGDDFDVVGRKQLLRKMKQDNIDIDNHEAAANEEGSISDTHSVTTDSLSLDQIVI